MRTFHLSIGSADMKKLLLFAGFLLILFPLSAQIDTELLTLNESRLQLNKTNMWVLGGWAIGNIGVSGILRSQTTGSTRYFHEMNAIWNVVNLGLAAGGLYGSYTADPAAFGLWETFAEQQKLEKILLFNLALNFTYITAGGYMIERSKNSMNRPERLKGYGQSLLLQGGFLLLFDTTQYLLHHNNAHSDLQRLIDGLTISGNGIGLTFMF